jgi:hypothetical protein
MDGLQRNYDTYTWGWIGFVQAKATKDHLKKRQCRDWIGLKTKTEKRNNKEGSQRRAVNGIGVDWTAVLPFLL